MNDHCRESLCFAGDPVNCDDGNVCTADTCHATSGCVHLPVEAPCDLPLTCTLSACVAGACQATAPIGSVIKLPYDLAPTILVPRPNGTLIGVKGNTWLESPYIRFYLIDSDGTMKMIREETPPGQFMACELSSGLSGGLSGLCVGNAHKTIAEEGLDGWIAQLGKDAGIIWQKKYGLSLRLGFERLSAFPDGGATVLGKTTPFFQEYLSTQRSVILRTGHKGVVLWSRIDQELLGGAVRDLVAAPDGATLLVGDKRYRKPLPWRTVPFLAKLDVQGHKDWYTEFAPFSPSANAIAERVHRIVGGGLIIGGRSWGPCDPATPVCPQCTAGCSPDECVAACSGPLGVRLTRVTSAHGTAWRALLNSNDVWPKVLGLAAVGTTHALALVSFLNPSPDPGKISCRHGIVRFDEWGRLEWQHAFAAYCGETIRLMLVDNDGRFVLEVRGTKGPVKTADIVRATPWGHTSCQEAGKCARLTLADCDDGDACTRDGCEPDVGCTHELWPAGTRCGIAKVCKADGRCAPK